jgi:gamma-glutamylcyclotransferase (GGCT)/AIG2-like uncharacterized protein YtfP
MADFLAQRARYLSHAKMRGRLYHLGRFPGMTPAQHEDDWVLGDLFELPDDKDATLRALDGYENDESPQPGHFERAPAEAVDAAGCARQVSVYWYRGPVAEGARVLNGDWLTCLPP